EREESREGRRVRSPHELTSRIEDRIGEPGPPFHGRRESEAGGQGEGGPREETVGRVRGEPHPSGRLQDLRVAGREQAGEVVELPARRGPRVADEELVALAPGVPQRRLHSTIGARPHALDE